MTFIISGSTRTGFNVVLCRTIQSALKKSGEWVRGGYADVLIANDAGFQYTAAEFTRLFRV